MATVEVKLHLFLTSALEQGELLNLRPSHSSPGNEPRYQLNMSLGGTQSRSECSG